MDWETAIGYILGGSGIAGWLLTYLELRQQRQLEAKRLFRELVLTPEVLQLYGSEFDLLDLEQASVELKAGKQPLIRLPETKGLLVKIANEAELNDLTLKVFDRIDNLVGKVSSSALTLLLPIRLKKKAGDFMRALKSCKDMNDVENARTQLFEFGEELKKVLGLDILE